MQFVGLRTTFYTWAQTAQASSPPLQAEADKGGDGAGPPGAAGADVGGEHVSAGAAWCVRVGEGVCARLHARTHADDPCVGVRASLHASFLAYSCNGGGKPPPHMCIHVCKAIMGKLPGGFEGCASACIWRLQCAAAPVSTTCMHA